jgi:isopenicillin N synthase-like dioxygenase
MVVPLATPEQLPIIDISPLYDNSDQQQQAAVAAAIRTACLNTGFFYVSGQRLPQSTGIFKCMQQLFDLPDSSKAKLDANLSPLHRGYTGLGGAHNCVPDETTFKGPDNKESYLFGKRHATAAAAAEPLLKHPPPTHTHQALCIHHQQQQQLQPCSYKDTQPYKHGI